MLEKVPATQGEHVVMLAALVVLKKPGLQEVPLPGAEHWLEPAMETSDAAHCRQSVSREEPAFGLYVLLGHGVCRVEFEGQ